MYKSLGCLALVAGLALAGCGESKGDRAISGGALGAAGGAAVGGLTGGSPLTGALIGGAGGAAAGALTNRNDVDLGKPVWR
jgi:osmotically inducible lipoprotein OsmB